MSTLEALLRLTAIQIELMRIAGHLDGRRAEIVRYTARILRLLRTSRGGASS
jgi:hypothetical protein